MTHMLIVLSRKSKLNKELQGFVSKADRFKKLNNVNGKVGPGSYNLRGRTSKYLVQKPQKLKSNSPFISGETRFIFTFQKKMSPGPGAYKTNANMLKKNRKINKKISFGVETIRNTSMELHKNNPGPGHYSGLMNHTIEHQTNQKAQESRNAYGRVIPKSSSMFLSNVKKDSSYILPLNCDADYTTDAHTIATKIKNNKRSSLIIPVRSLKKPDSRAGLRGPGHYKIKNFLETSKPYRNSSAFISKEKRFNGPKRINPGPADYSANIL